MNLKEQRAKYVYEKVQEYRNRPKAFIDLSRQLFLSERTIRRDFDTVSKNRST